MGATLSIKPTRTVDEPPADTRGRPGVWGDRLAEARRVAPKWAVWDFAPNGGGSSVAAAKRAAKKAPGGADAYDIVSRATLEGRSLFIRYRKSVRSAS